MKPDLCNFVKIVSFMVMLGSFIDIFGGIDGYVTMQLFNKLHTN